MIANLYVYVYVVYTNVRRVLCIWILSLQVLIYIIDYGFECGIKNSLFLALLKSESMVEFWGCFWIVISEHLVMI